MKTRVKGIGPGHYSVQANSGPKTRYEEIGQVWKEGSKWRATGYDDTLPNKKFGVAWVVGQHKMVQSAFAAMKETLPTITMVDDTPVEEKWPENAKWAEGTTLRHHDGYRGALHTCFFASTGKLRYGIRIMAGKAGVYGYAKDFKEVEV